MQHGYARYSRDRIVALTIVGSVGLAATYLFPITQGHAQNIDGRSQHQQRNQPELVQSLAIAPNTPDLEVNQNGDETTRARASQLVLFDVYVDEDRPLIKREVSKDIAESIELLKSQHGSRLSVESYCDQRDTVEYSMVLSHKRTTQLEEFINDLQIPSQHIVAASYGNVTPRCADKTAECWENNVRIQSTFKYLAIAASKLGCLVRVGLTDINNKSQLKASFIGQQYLQKIRLAPVTSSRIQRARVHVPRPKVPHKKTAAVR